MSDNFILKMKSYMRWISGALLAGCVVAIAGCTVGPNYKPPEPNVPAEWVGPRIGAEGQSQELVNWWTKFGDPNLTSLIERAVQSNLDLKVAESRIQQARATRGMVSAGFWPIANLTGAGTRSRSAQGTVSNLYQAGLDSSWELDIFGGTRRNIEAADADLLAAVETRQDALVTLTAEVALNYIDLRGFQRQIFIAKENLQAQKHTADVTRQKFQGGFVSALDVANADAQVATTSSQIPPLEQSARQTIYNISILLGLEPAALVQELSPESSIPPAPPEVPIGIPSDLLRRRPDIRRAEAQIHAATARIGVATADLFPSLSLSASAGFSSNQLDSLINWHKRLWSIGPSVDWRIFDAGRIGYNIKLQKALREETLLTYQQAVLTALQEVENSLIASAKEQEHRDAIIKAVAANRKAVALSTQLYAEGQTDFLNVLNAQRSLYASEDALVQSTRTVSTNLVALYKALGGGWSEQSENTVVP